MTSRSTITFRATPSLPGPDRPVRLHAGRGTRTRMTIRLFRIASFLGVSVFRRPQYPPHRFAGLGTHQSYGNLATYFMFTTSVSPSTAELDLIEATLAMHAAFADDSGRGALRPRPSGAIDISRDEHGRSARSPRAGFPYARSATSARRRVTIIGRAGDFFPAGTAAVLQSICLPRHGLCRLIRTAAVHSFRRAPCCAQPRGRVPYSSPCHAFCSQLGRITRRRFVALTPDHRHLSDPDRRQCTAIVISDRRAPRVR